MAAPTRGPTSDFWYQELGHRSSAGMPVSPDTALTIGAVYRAVRLLADDVSQLPLHLYERLPDRQGGLPGGRRQVHNDLAEVLAIAPNGVQTSFEWREMMTSHLLLRGNAYSRVISGARGYVDQLLPMDPSRMRAEYTDAGRILYLYRNHAGREERLTQDEVFHIPGFRMNPDDPCGLSVVGLARTSMGLTMATEEFGARQFSQTPRPSFILTSPNKIERERRKDLEQSFRRMTAGPRGWGGTPIMDDGLTAANVGMSHDDAQFLETRTWQVRDVARWFGLPPHMLGDLADATFSNIEHASIDYVTRPLMPLLVRWELAIKRQLILDATYAKFNANALLRGDTLSRAQAQQLRANTKSLTPNEIREQEDMNPVPWGDEPLQPQGAPAAPASSSTPPKSAGSVPTNRLAHVNGSNGNG